MVHARARVTDRALRAFATIICLALVAGCQGDEQQAGWSADILDAQDPDGKRPLQALADDEVTRALEAVRVEINKARPKGVADLIASARKELAATGLDTTCLESINDKTIGEPMPGGTVADLEDDKERTGVSSKTFALKQDDHKKYYACPVLAPEKNTGTSCDKAVQGVLKRVKDKIDQHREQVAQTIAETYSALSATSQQFIAAWALTAQQYGAEVAAIYAAHHLKAASQCDNKANAKQIAYELGVEQGWQIVLGLRAWALQQVNTCTVNTDAIAQQVRVMARSQVTGFMKQNTVCDDADLSSLNEALSQAEVIRQEGIYAGIDQRVEILRNELFQARASVPCDTGGGGAEPLVIDLDGDGLTPSEKRVEFDLLADGTRQSTGWIGPREGILSLDLDGDRTISSAAELLGDKSCCGGNPCYDGAAALAAYDAPSRGGNGDGVIDPRDSVYDLLLIWVDKNQDGRSQTDELAGLRQHGIQAFDLQAKHYIARLGRAGTVSAELSLMTRDGPRSAYDVWLNLRLRPENLRSLLPRR